MRKILSCILAAAMLLSLLVVAGAAETDTPGKVILRPSAKVSGDGTVTYTFTLDATESDGVGALEFFITPRGMTYESVAYKDGGKLDEVFKSEDDYEGVTGYGFYETDGHFIAFGGNANAEPPRMLTNSVPLIAVTYKITDTSDYGLANVTFKACYSGEKAMNESGRYTCQVAAVTTEPTGVTVSGTAISWNNSDDAEYLLYPGDTADDTIKAEWKNGAYPTALDNTADKGAVAANADGKRYDQSFTFGNVAAGEYKLVILKPGKYVPKIVAITVGTADLALGEQKLWLYGDVTYDGKVKIGDAIQMLRYIAELRTFSDEQVLATDITGDGKIKPGDVTQVKKFIAELPSKFDDMK